MFRGLFLELHRRLSRNTNFIGWHVRGWRRVFKVVVVDPATWGVVTSLPPPSLEFCWLSIRA